MIAIVIWSLVGVWSIVVSDVSVPYHMLMMGLVVGTVVGVRSVVGT